MIKLNKYIFTDELINDMKVLIKESSVNNKEYGFNLYPNFENSYLLEHGTVCEGSSCEVTVQDLDKRKSGRLEIGDFHTHPNTELEKQPAEDLSTDDLYDILSHEITCVGFNDNRMSCYILNVSDYKEFSDQFKKDKDNIKKYILKIYHNQLYDVTDEEFFDIWERIFNKYILIYYVDLATQQIEER